MNGQIRVEQVGNGFVARCPIHGVLRPEPDKVWVSHIGASMAAVFHAAFAFHGKGAR